MSEREFIAWLTGYLCGLSGEEVVDVDLIKTKINSICKFEQFPSTNDPHSGTQLLKG